MIVFYSIIVLELILFGLLDSGYLSYWAGKNGLSNFTVFMHTAKVVGIFLICLVVLAIILCWFKSWWQSVVNFSLIAMVVIVFIFGKGLFPHPEKPSFLVGFNERLSNKIDVPAIRAWMSTLKFEDGKDVPSPWPEVIDRLEPEYVLMREDEGRKTIEIRWGSGFSHWGLTVGPEALMPPLSMHDADILPHKAGAYFFAD